MKISSEDRATLTKIQGFLVSVAALYPKLNTEASVYSQALATVLTENIPSNKTNEGDRLKIVVCEFDARDASEVNDETPYVWYSCTSREQIIDFLYRVCNGESWTGQLEAANGPVSGIPLNRIMSRKLTKPPKEAELRPTGRFFQVKAGSSKNILILNATKGKWGATEIAKARSFYSEHDKVGYQKMISSK